MKNVIKSLAAAFVLFGAIACSEAAPEATATPETAVVDTAAVAPAPADTAAVAAPAPADTTKK